MRKLFTLFLVGVAGIVVFLIIQKILTGDGSISVICKNADKTIMIKFDPTSEKMISATNQDGSEYKIEDAEERIKKIGVLKYIDEFMQDFKAKNNGVCFKKE